MTNAVITTMTSQPEPKIDITLLICPSCSSDSLRDQGTALSCDSCGKAYRRDSGKIFFTDNYFDVDKWEKESSGFDLLQRKRPQSVFSVDKLGGPRIRDLKSYLGVDGVVLNLGSGKDAYEGQINLDLGRYPSVDIVTSLERIPYKDSSVDMLVSNSVLEHIYDYNSVIQEIRRVLKPGGYLYLSVPSLCMRHHAYDFHRWTEPGLVRLLDSFDLVEHGSCRNVAYALVSIVEALIVSKTKPGLLREAIRNLWLFASYPLFWLRDEPTPEYISMSQTIYAIARKPI
jgi:hypothetical protein